MTNTYQKQTTQSELMEKFIKLISSVKYTMYKHNDEYILINNQRKTYVRLKNVAEELLSDRVQWRTVKGGSFGKVRKQNYKEEMFSKEYPSIDILINIAHFLYGNPKYAKDEELQAIFNNVEDHIEYLVSFMELATNDIKEIIETYI